LLPGTRGICLCASFSRTSASPSPTMILPNSPRSDEAEHLLRNAQLRDALEPLLDESIGRVNVEVMTTGAENDFLESMLEWERGPRLAIGEWFQPKLELPHPDDLSDDQIRDRLYQTIGR